VSRYAAATFSLMTGLGIITLVLGVGLSFVITVLFKIPTELHRDARITCVLVALAVAIIAIQSAILGLLRGFQLYVLSNLAQILGALLRAALIFLVLRTKSDIITLQLCYCGAEFFTMTLATIMALILIPGVRFFVWPGMAVYREIYGYTQHSLLRSASNLFMYATMIMLVGWFGSVRDVAIYSLATRIPQVVRGLLASAQAVFLPAFSTLLAKEGPGGIVRVIRSGMRFNVALTFAVVALFIAYTEPMLRLWLGNEYDPRIVTPMVLLLLACVPTGAFELWLPALDAMNILRSLSVATFLSFIGASPPVAAATAILAVLTVRSGCWLPIYGALKTHMTLSTYLRDTLLRPILALAMFAGLLAAVFAVMPPPVEMIPFLLHGLVSATMVGVVTAVVVLPQYVVSCLKAATAMVRR
jgi:O-antigen/teichoic acid export membrane protein